MPLHAIICADWGKTAKKRAAYVANVPGRLVYRIPSPDGWNVKAILAEANRLSSGGPVLATFDAPLGVPKTYLAAAASVSCWNKPEGFLDFLHWACQTPKFFDPSKRPEEWSVDQPFFGVPPESNGLKSYIEAASRHGVELRRRIDGRTKAKSLFITSGIPGSVGSATSSLWREFGSLLTSGRTFQLWPFEGDIRSLMEQCPVTVGEMYPRAAYATALLDGSIESRPPLSVAKTHADIRRSVIQALVAKEWVGRQDVRIEGLEEAQENEDDFDACLTAAALLRCELDQLPLFAPSIDPGRIEGGILGTGSINLELHERSWPMSVQANKAAASIATGGTLLSENTLRCPIEGCDKKYAHGRGGWDSHVGSVRIHPQWHPQIIDSEKRKRIFRTEFPGFFACSR